MALRLDQLDVSMLADFVDQHDCPGAFVDPATGEWWPCFDYEVRDDDGELIDPDEMGLIPIGGEGSSAAYRDMEVFAQAIAEPATRGRLLDSLQGRGAFRRFKDAVWHLPEEVGRAWNRYREGCAELRVLAWAAEHELVSVDEIRAAQQDLEIRLDAVLAGVSHRRSVSSVVDIADKLASFSEHWSPKVVARLNDYEIKLVKLKGEFVWHTHEDTDELFLVVEGSLTIQLRDGDVTLGPGQLYVVPCGVEHCPIAEGDVSVMLIEPEGVVNTGDAGGELTAGHDESLLDV